MAARAANGGALPPDLSLIAYARDGGDNYLYAVSIDDESDVVTVVVNSVVEWLL